MVVVVVVVMVVVVVRYKDVCKSITILLYLRLRNSREKANFECHVFDI